MAPKRSRQRPAGRPSIACTSPYAALLARIFGRCYPAAVAEGTQQLSCLYLTLADSLLRAKPPKGGDAELGDYGDQGRHVSPAASDSRRFRVSGGRFIFLGPPNAVRLDRPSRQGETTKANPAKAGDAKPRGYRTRFSVPRQSSRRTSLSSRRRGSCVYRPFGIVRHFWALRCSRPASSCPTRST